MDELNYHYIINNLNEKIKKLEAELAKYKEKEYYTTTSKPLDSPIMLSSAEYLDLYTDKMKGTKDEL